LKTGFDWIWGWLYRGFSGRSFSALAGKAGVMTDGAGKMLDIARGGRQGDHRFSESLPWRRQARR
jgi:hypothetical protein